MSPRLALPLAALGLALAALAFWAGTRWPGVARPSSAASASVPAPGAASTATLPALNDPSPTAPLAAQGVPKGAATTALPVPTATDAPPTATPTAPPPTATPTAPPPTATLTAPPPSATHTPRPPTATHTPRPPTPTRVATATPVYVLLEDREALWEYVTPTYTPSPTPTAIPPVLLGKIAFRSNLMGSKTKGKVLLVDPDGRNLALLVDPWAYEAVCELERLSPDGRYRVDQARGQRGLDLWLASVAGGARAQLTFVGKGQAYDAAWFPDGRRIAFASNQEGDDDIFVVTLGDPAAPQPQTINLTPGDTWESDKHPSVSPDGQFIVFYSNRTGRNQIWIMAADGTNPRQLVALDGDCWDPIWFKPCYARP